MKIKEFEVYGFMGREYSIVLNFNDDLNIITGKNGSGKTTLLKLIWYVISGNILLALKEIKFKKARIVTDIYDCTINNLGSNRCNVYWKDLTSGQEFLFKDVVEYIDDDGDPVVSSNAEDQANVEILKHGSSIFLPTFRRIEGGFSIKDVNFNPFSKNKIEIEESLQGLSKKLSNGKHIFIAALSTSDIVTMLVRKYADLSEEYNNMQKNVSQEIVEKIKIFKRGEQSSDLTAAMTVIEEVNSQIHNMESMREKLMTPIESVNKLAMEMFSHAGIRLTKTLSFGDSANSVNSDELSAGEKQMFSFIAYNSFYTDAIFIIDEPELSLHVDWQRQLFPKLLSQQSTNQFIIATHSPFIYSKYPDKELQIDEDRGCSME